MRSRLPLALAGVVFAVITAVTGSAIVARDRADTERVVEERTSSMARMMIAHADVAFDAAETLMASVLPLVANWDLRDEAMRQEIQGQLHEHVSSNSLLLASWIVDQDGKALVREPPVSLDQLPGAADRSYFKAHAAGAREPVILGDEQPGTVTNKLRSTYSRTVRKTDGSLKAIVVVGINRTEFDQLYDQTANWLGARAGLHTMDGEVLARLNVSKPFSEPFKKEIRRLALSRDAGSAIVVDGEESRLVSWQRSSRHPRAFATSSQPMDAALADWRSRAETTWASIVIANLLFLALLFYVYRTIRAQQQARANEMAVREVYHRVLNSLQIAVSMLQMRAQRSGDQSYKDAAKDIASHLIGISESYRFVHQAQSIDSVEVCQTLKGLCEHLERSFERNIDLKTCDPIEIDSRHATSLCIIVNELVTNAVKHGGQDIAVLCVTKDGRLLINVSNAGNNLPVGFDLSVSKGFGLKAIRALLDSIHGELVAEPREKGALFSVTIPLSELRGKGGSTPT